MVPETGVQSQANSYQRLKNDAALPNTEKYKVSIKG